MGTSNNWSFVSNSTFIKAFSFIKSLHEKKIAYVLKVIPFSKNAVFAQKNSY